MKPLIVIFALGLSTSTSAQARQSAEVELRSPEELGIDYRRRSIGAGMLGLGLALTISSAPVMLLEAIAADNPNAALLATHAVATAVGTSLLVGGIIRLVRTARNGRDGRRRLRRRMIPLVVFAALSHAAASFVSVLATTDVGAGFGP